MSELTDELNAVVQGMLDNDDSMTEASWGMQEGVILAGEQLQGLLADIDIGDRRLDEAHEALSAVYSSGVDLQEHESVVREVLGLNPTHQE